MPKLKTLKKPSKSVTKSLKAHVPFKSKDLSDAVLVIDALLECIRTNDLSSFREVLAAHLMTVNKMELS